MAKMVSFDSETEELREAIDLFRGAGVATALTGAGISVESGIPDFRSPAGLWSKFSPQEYATIDVFLNNPQKAWNLYRSINETIESAEPNAAHEALARLEKAGLLDAVVTQNVDGLHRAAGSQKVIEVHGDHQHLQCLECGKLYPVEKERYEGEKIPTCPECKCPLKPNVVLFGEPIRATNEITALLSRTDVLLLIGTSCEVYPVGQFPAMVSQHNGWIFEFNISPTRLTEGNISFFPFLVECRSNYFFGGPATKTVSSFAEMLLADL